MKYWALKPWSFVEEESSIPTVLLHMFDGLLFETFEAFTSLLIKFSAKTFLYVCTCEFSL